MITRGRWVAVAVGAVVIAGGLLPVLGCGGARSPRLRTTQVNLTVRSPHSSPVVMRVDARRLPVRSRIVGLAVMGVNLRVAQAAAVTDISARYTFRVQRAVASRNSHVLALARDGRHIAVSSADGVRVGGGTPLRVGTTTVGGFDRSLLAVLDGRAARLFNGRVVNLSTAQTLGSESYTGTAVSASADVIALGTEDGAITQLRASDGGVVRTWPRRSRGRFGAAITAIDATAAHVVALDREGWVSCDGRVASAIMPPAPPGMPSALRITDDGAWIVRGGRAARVACRPRAAVLRCMITSRHADLRSAALAVAGQRVVAAGVVAGAVIELPRCS